jgi:hypothetical protein
VHEGFAHEHLDCKALSEPRARTGSIFCSVTCMHPSSGVARQLRRRSCSTRRATHRASKSTPTS